MQIEEREASRASTLDASSPLAFRVITRVPIAFSLHPLGNLEFVVQLKHRLLLLEKSGSRLSGSRCWLACSFLLRCGLLRCGFGSRFDRHRSLYLALFADLILRLWGCKGSFGLCKKVDLAFVWDGDVSGERETQGEAG